MKNWKTNLGGAISVTGTSLIGIGVLPQLMGGSSKLLMGIAIAGFVLSALGKGVTALFAADATTANAIATEVDRINREGPSPAAAPVAKVKADPAGGPGGTAVVVFLLVLLALGAGCAVVPTDMFPKFTWYWSADAKAYRGSQAPATNAAPAKVPSDPKS